MQDLPILAVAMVDVKKRILRIVDVVQDTVLISRSIPENVTISEDGKAAISIEDGEEVEFPTNKLVMGKFRYHGINGCAVWHFESDDGEKALGGRVIKL